ncbi:hypothetical protein K461DRAFT_267204 [Myriangium duriaei CBS 260.36]|uniref:Uncharacterized protein n=1 Tax=Myriangium duriaei CBS 260.36 TaxID=1168546 RepID=A0A9P4J297_9PEZI|nr:hypothetical protein K461DRAFT_267204 [Myriangium duriaei CBS 260.36]
MYLDSPVPFIDALDNSTRESYFDDDDSESLAPTVLESPDEHIYEDKSTLQLLAKRLSMMNAFATNDSPMPTLTVAQYLENSRLSLRALALTFNILANYRVDTPFNVLKRQDSHHDTAASKFRPENTHSSASELVFVSAMRLAAGYLEERPMTASWWSAAVTAHVFGGDDISMVSMDMYSCVGWKIPLWAEPDAIESALGVSQPARSMSLPDVKAMRKARACEMLTPPLEATSPLNSRQCYF